ncbi:hypothetical protein [Halobacillus amylolyticus]|uniref:DUF4025 domain-containing protein n=1 Tax=Halobacillus amylolyticus TaxID=2932259 RepID=A0ABY4HF00_9BACI|nr:hypothetical protein [Halobacillus amylolyticus]UOR12873.1 hypothetical protein MUO15_05015 [Halobacillus amylolyticus]
MKKQPKKKFDFPTQTNTSGEIGVESGLKANQPSDTEDRFTGDSVDEHNELEAANEDIAQKEISQVFNNS